nr:hypothetical protein [Luteithermobacter gelatinilyticus]
MFFFLKDNKFTRTLSSFLTVFGFSLVFGFMPAGQLLAERQAAIIDYSSIHHPVVGREGMVVSQSRLASEVGAEILRKGGMQWMPPLP